jgi:hypothetical protein
MSRPRYSLRVAAVSVLVLAVSVGLTGCTPAPTGRSATATEQQIESIPGVDSAVTHVTRSQDGLTTTQIVAITVVVTDGYHISDADAAIVWITREAWSAGPRRPSVIGFSFDNASGQPLDWGWKAALAARGWDVPLIDGNMEASNVIGLSGSNMTSLTGTSWPGPVPETPANLFVKN